MPGKPAFLGMVVDEDKVRRVVRAATGTEAKPMKMKELADAADFSGTTIGRYVDIAEVQGLLRTERYGSVRQVWITDEGKRWLTTTGNPTEAKGRGAKK